MLVAGFSGIGKTAVVNEVHKPIVRQRGYFIKGKFDQFQRNIPFSAFVQAFRDLMGQLLTETDTQLKTMADKNFICFGENGQVIIEVIPELEQIIGKQPPAIEFLVVRHKIASIYYSRSLFRSLQLRTSISDVFRRFAMGRFCIAEIDAIIDE